MNQDESRIKAKVRLHNYRFPKERVPVSGAFAIIVFDVIEVKEGNIPLAAYENAGTKSIIVAGEMPRIEKEMEYNLEAVLVKDRKYGLQYKCKNIQTAYDLKNADDQRAFFSYFLTEKQIESLFGMYDNPVEKLANRDIEALTKIKGIGPVVATRLCDKYADNVSNSRAYVSLKGLGITKNAIISMIKQVGSADVVVDMIQENPYILIRMVRGYGWEKADAIARRKGFPTDCKERCIAYAKFRLDQNADEGNSCMSIGELLEDTAAVCAPVSKENLSAYIKEEMVGQADFDKLYERIKRKESVEYPLFFYSAETKKVGLFSLRLVEHKIAEELKRLKEGKSLFHYDKSVCERIIKEVEEEQGYTYTMEQRRAIWSILDNNLSILTGPAGCVDRDTEFFDGTKWKKISDYKEGDQVLIYGTDGVARLEKPERYIKLPCNQLWLTQTKYGVDMCTCEEHNVYYITSKGNLYHQPFAKIKEMHESSAGGFSGRFITTFNVDRPGIDLSDAEIKVMLAVIADGSFNKGRKTKHCRFHIKKDRKKDELRAAFREAGLPWKESSSSAEGYTDFYCYVPRQEKQFTDYWYNCSQHQLEVICQNVLKWDGHVQGERHSFSANDKMNADFIQYAFSACGYRATVIERDRRGQEYFVCGKAYTRKSIEYTVNITKRNLISMGGFHKENANKTKIVPYETKDGFKYCFTVSSHIWIMRRNGKIMITGNCGKSSTVKPLIRIFEYYGLEVGQCALSGRAASLLTEYTGLVGKTIHRLLAYSPDLESFTYTARSPLPQDVIILDESSMVGEELFLSLIEAIRTGAKLVMLGDIKQLPPISVGNILSDCMGSGYISTTPLTVIHRQALKSGIISESMKVCEGHNLVKNDAFGEEIRGELKDLKVGCYSDPALVHMKAIEEFKHLMNKGVKPEDIQIVVPVRARGANSCRAFNSEIQRLVNGDPKKKHVEINMIDNGMQYVVSYKPGDKIMVVKNNYHAKNVYGKEVSIFNGNMGHIVDIDKNEMIVQLDEQGEVLLPKEEWGNITHAWACTAHKLQGSQSPYVIVCVDYSSYTLLMREWLYTALTRSGKYCALIGQPKAINTACRTSNIKVKQTWLRGELNDLFVKEVC